jgi:hypothetical protein
MIGLAAVPGIIGAIEAAGEPDPLSNWWIRVALVMGGVGAFALLVSAGVYLSHEFGGDAPADPVNSTFASRAAARQEAIDGAPSPTVAVSAAREDPQEVLREVQDLILRALAILGPVWAGNVHQIQPYIVTEWCQTLDRVVRNYDPSLIRHIGEAEPPNGITDSDKAAGVLMSKVTGLDKVVKRIKQDIADAATP